jgi:endonuclease/exonuclease/phosphatase (EEP) superfamily protein YafD
MSGSASNRQNPQSGLIRWRGQSGLLGLSAALWLAVSLCYALRPDAWAAVTVLPAWVWLPPGVLLAGLGWCRAGKRFAAVVGLLWLLYLLFLVDEWRSLVRLRPWPAPDGAAARQRGEALRVVSLNCAGGSMEAAAEVAAHEPDLVLLQETPGVKDVERLARQLFGAEGAVHAGPDAAILARGRLTPVPLLPSHRVYFIQARVRLSSGIETEVISLRLVPPSVRLDLWSPGCWREQSANRRARRDQLRAVAQQIEALPSWLPVIAGGDFNAPAGDAVFRLLRPRLWDSFREAGIGWGNTIINGFPFHRIDQIWISDSLRAAAVVARKTRHSDHRMVIADLRLRTGGWGR